MCMLGFPARPGDTHSSHPVAWRRWMGLWGFSCLCITHIPFMFTPQSWALQRRRAQNPSKARYRL